MVTGRVLAIVLCRNGIHDTYENSAGAYYCIRCGKSWGSRMDYIEREYDMTLQDFISFMEKDE